MRMTMKHFIQTLLVLTLLSACGQKGPLIIETTASDSTQVQQEVPEQSPVLNTQTQEASSTR